MIFNTSIYTGKPPPGSRNQWVKRFQGSWLTFVKGCSVPGYFMHVVTCGQCLKTHTLWCPFLQVAVESKNTADITSESIYKVNGSIQHYTTYLYCHSEFRMPEWGSPILSRHSWFWRHIWLNKSFLGVRRGPLDAQWWPLVCLGLSFWVKGGPNERRKTRYLKTPRFTRPLGGPFAPKWHLFLVLGRPIVALGVSRALLLCQMGARRTPKNEAS